MIKDIFSLFVSRALQCIIVVFLVGLLSFAMFRYIGDPVLAMINTTEVSHQDIESFRESLGLNEAFYVQYLSYLGRAIRGNFGNSYQYKTPVLSLIFSRAPATIELALVAFAVSLLLGIAFGIFTAIQPHKFSSQALGFTSSLGISIPSFIIGVFLIYMFTVIIPLFPTFGRGGTISIGAWKSSLLTARGIQYIILPAATLAVYQIAFIQRVVHTEMQEMLEADFVRYAYLRGIAPKRIYLAHALRNIFPQLINIVLMQLGGLIAFASITESIFQWPGIGYLFIESLQNADIPVLSTYLILIGVLFVMLNFISDVCQLLIDPRTRKSLGARA